MKKYIPVLLLLASLQSLAQVSPSKYWIKLKDKNNTPYSLNNPIAFLTQRALNRRAAQNIPIDSTDLPVDPAYVAAINATGAQVIHTSRWFNSALVYVSSAAQLTSVQSLPFVASSQPVFKKYKVNPVEKFERESYSSAKQSIVSSGEGVQGLNYGNGFNQVNMIGANFLHVAGYQGQGMVIAVLDAGFYQADIDPAYDSLRANNQVLGVRDFVNNDGSVYEDYWHGAAVLSTMAANLPGQLVGTAPKAGYWLIRTEDANTEYVIEECNWIVGAEFADSVGADVINSSLGYTTFNEPTQDHTYAQLDGNTAIGTMGADKAASKGILVINSAGNDGGNGWGYIGVPADGDSVFTIAAVDANRVRAGFSSVGPSADGRIKPNVAAQGANAAFSNGAGGATFGNGTSFASPIIAGATACLAQAFPEKNNMEILDAIQRSCDHYNTPDSLTGYGIPNYSIAFLLLSQPEYAASSKVDMLEVYPNPFAWELNFVYYSRKAEMLKIELLDLSGRVVYADSRLGYNNSYMQLSVKEAITLPAGIYFLKVSGQQGSLVKKVVKD